MLKISHYKQGVGLLTCSAILAFMTTPAFAVPTMSSFNFAALADGSFGESAYASLSVMDNGVTVIATARSLDNTSSYLAYLDSSTGAGPAGLGVCKELGTGQTTGPKPGSGSNVCSDSSDDNITNGELLVLNFSKLVTIQSLLLRDGGHGQTWTGNFGIIADGTAPTTTTPFGTGVNPGSGTVNLGLTGTTFYIISPGTLDGTTPEANQFELYVNAVSVTSETDPVPEPASVALFGTGLLALAGWRAFASQKSSEK